MGREQRREYALGPEFEGRSRTAPSSKSSSGGAASASPAEAPRDGVGGPLLPEPPLLLPSTERLPVSCSSACSSRRSSTYSAHRAALST